MLGTSASTSSLACLEFDVHVPLTIVSTPAPFMARPAYRTHEFMTPIGLSYLHYQSSIPCMRNEKSTCGSKNLKCPMNPVLPGSPTSEGSMADARGGGQGAYERPWNVYGPWNLYAAAVALRNFRPAVPAEARFDLAAALRGPLPTKSNSIFTLHPSLSKY